MDIIVHPSKIIHQGILKIDEKSYPCALGSNGIGVKDREGDGITPLGKWPIRYGFYREDRLSRPESAFPFLPISRDMGWCDEPGDPYYNRLIKHPYAASHESLWREDHMYDLILVLGFNDDPVVPAKGSAIFMHIAGDDYSPTAGCIALSKEDFHSVLLKLTHHSMVDVRGD